MIRCDNLIFFETENPYRDALSIKTKLASRLIEIASTGFVFQKSIIVCPDPYRMKLNRRFYGFRRAAVIPLIRLDFDYPKSTTTISTPESIGEKVQVGYLGRVTTTTGSEILMHLDNLDWATVVCVGRLYRGHVSDDFLASPLAKSVEFVEDFRKALDVMSNCEICVAITIENRRDIGTKYQTPTKIWDYTQLSKRFIATDSPSIRYYLRNFSGVEWVSRTPTMKEIHKALIVLRDRDVDPSEYAKVLERGTNIYEENLTEICNLINHSM